MDLIHSTINWLQQISEYFLNALEQGSYLAIALLMGIESSLIPFPSEIIMIPAGMLVAEGRMNFFAALGASILGSLGGAFINYYIAYFFGRPIIFKIGRYFWLSPEKITSIEEYFYKYGDLTTFFGRLIPGVRQLISLPAGLARMNPAKFALYTGLGAGIWSLILILIGIVFSKLQQDWHILWQQYKILILCSTLVLAGIVLTLWLAVKKHKKSS